MQVLENQKKKKAIKKVITKNHTRPETQKKGNVFGKLKRHSCFE